MQAVVCLPLLTIGLRLFGLGRLRRLLVCFAIAGRKPSRFGAADELEVVQYARGCATIIAMAGSSGLIKATCLPRSVMLWWLLLRRGVDCDLRLGVRTEDATLEAHAWVERNGVVLNDTEDVKQRYSAFAPLGVES